MIKNYIKIAWRNLMKDKSYSFINIFGLTLGIVSCLCMTLYINEQLGYDAHHEHADEIYRVRTQIVSTSSNADFSSAGASPAIAFGIKDEFPEVVEACRVVHMMDANGSLLKTAESTQAFFEPKGYLADSTFFDVFTYEFVEGNAQSALRAPMTMVLSNEVARKLFADNSAVGQSVIMGDGGNEQTYEVTGVFNEKFAKSHLQPRYIISMNSPGLGEFVRTNQQWATQNFVYSYVKLVPGADPLALQQKLPTLLEKRAGKALRDMGFNKTLYVQSIKDIHLYSRGVDNQIDKVSDINYLYLLFSLAGFIILVASINFIILSTARSNQRSREIGVRKVLGANKFELVAQFLSESITLSFLSTVLAVPATWLLLPYLNNLTNSEIAISALATPQMIGTIVGVGVLTGLLAGFYPALYLSAIRTIQSLKGATNLKSGAGLMRKSLVVCQFVISMILIVGVITISKQMKYAQTKDLGFKKSNRIAVKLGTYDARGEYDALKNEFLKISGVLNVAGCDQSPSEFILSDWGLYLPGGDPTQLLLTKNNNVSMEYFASMDIPLIAGRDLARRDTSNEIIVNQAFLKDIGIEFDNAVGSKILAPWEGETVEFMIVGVHKDYHFNSLREPITPLMTGYTRYPNSIVIETDGREYDQKIAALESTWKTLLPAVPFSYSFLDEEIERYYVAEKSQSKLSIVFTLLAILISCLGLFGLVTFTAEQRKKEIGVRKVLGASVSGLVSMLSKEFVLLLFISFLIATPISWYFMNGWLQEFVYRIDLQWWMFLLAGLITLSIALITVSFQAFKAARANPINSLRTE